MNKYQKLYEDIELTCLCVGTYEDTEEYLEPLRELINHCETLEKQFADQDNTDEFQHFKLHSDSTLKSLKKDELISYIKMVYHNWDVCDENLKNIADNITILDDALTRACERVEYENNDGKMNADTECPGTVYVTPSKCNEDFCRGSNAECWKEWFLHLAKQKNRK